VLGRLVDFAETTTITLRDLVATQRDIGLAILRIEGRLDRIEARLETIEDALRGPGHN